MDAYGFIVFAGLAVAMTALALAFVLPRLLRPPRRTPAAPSPSVAAANREALRHALAELDRESAAGLLAHDAYRSARLDLERRVLAEAVPEKRAAPAERRFAGVAIALGIALPLLAFGLYAVFGEPGALRLGAPRGFDAAAGPSERATRAELAAHVASHPRDGRGWILLARMDLANDRFDEAAHAYATALEVSAKVARDPAVWCEYADALGMAQGGSLEGPPREMIMRALALDPTHPKALEMAGSAAYEQRDYAAAARYWRTLLPQLRTDTSAHRELAAALARVEVQAAATPRDNK